MPKYNAEDFDAEELADDLADLGFKHLRVRRRGPLLTIESGSRTDPDVHARLRRETVSLWRLEMPTSPGWEPTPYREPMERHLTRLTTELAWALAPRPANPMRTSGPKH